MLKLTNVTKRYGSLVAVNDVSIDFNPGETTVLLGPSGSGKSTMLRCLNLLEIPQSGQLQAGEDVVDFSRPVSKSLVRKVRTHSAMVFQNFQLFPHLSALDNIVLGPVSTKAASREEAIAQGQALLEKVGLGDRGDSYPFQLSGGQQQRVAIARALAMNPDYLLCDEPTSALDPELEVEVTAVLDELAREGRAMLVVTHNMSFAKQTADRILFLEEGRIQFDGSPDEFFSAPTERIQRFLQFFLSPEQLQGMTGKSDKLRTSKPKEFE